MVESIEHFGTELKLHFLGDLERLDEAEVYVPITGSSEDIPASAILTGCWNTELLSQINAAS